MRNLVLLEQDYKELEKDIVKLSDEILNLETRLGLSSAKLKEIIVSQTNMNNTDDLLLKYIQKKTTHNLKVEKLNKTKNIINFYYELYKQSNNEDEMIFIEKNIKKYSNAKISVLHGGIDRTTIYRRVQEVTKKYNKLLDQNELDKQEIKIQSQLVLDELKTMITK